MSYETVKKLSLTEVFFFDLHWRSSDVHAFVYRCAGEPRSGVGALRDQDGEGNLESGVIPAHFLVRVGSAVCGADQDES